MATNDLTAREALAVLLRKLRDSDVTLEQTVRAAIDAGHDIEEQQQPAQRRRRPRLYRRTVRLTDAQALQVALDVLRAYFLEQALFIESANREFTEAALNGSDELSFGQLPDHGPSVPQPGVGDIKRLEVELQIETQITPADSPTQQLVIPNPSLVDGQRANLRRLEALIQEIEE